MRDRLITAALFGALLALMVAPLPLGWTTQVTSWSHGEADNHLWMHFMAAQSGGVWANIPEGTGLPLMDPISAPWVALGGLLGPASAWNFTWMACVCLALVGGLALGRELSGRIEGGWVGMAALGTAPFLAGMGAFGLTEAWPLGWLALALAALLRTRRTGHWSWVLAGALALGAFGLSGAYHALFAALVLPLVALCRSPSEAHVPKRYWLGVALLCLGGALITLPLALDMLEARQLWLSRWGQAAPVSVDPGWATHPVGGGADVLRALWPTWGGVPSGRSLYLGWGLLGLVALGLQRRSAWLGAAAALLWLLSLGTWLTVAGHPLLPGPAWLIAALPGGGALTHWYRATGPVVVLLAGLASLGAVRLVGEHRHSRWLALGMALALALEGTLFGGAPWPAQQYDPRPPAVLTELSGEGGLLLLPFDNRREPFSTRVPRTYDRWGPWLGRPLSENYEGPDALLQVRLVAAADAACGGEPTIPMDWRPPQGMTAPELPEDAVRAGRIALREAGVEHLVVLRERSPSPEACEALLRAWLGAPHTQSAEAVVWTP